MGNLTIRIRDASRKPLDDVVDVAILTRDGGAFREKKAQKGAAAQKMTGLDPLTTYVVRVYPLRHRPVQKFVSLAGKETAAVELYCPIDPERAKPAFPTYTSIHATAKVILERSPELESYPGLAGQALYSALPNEPKAGLLNIVAKAAVTKLDDQSSVLDQIDSVYRIRGDRIFANVRIGLRDMIISATSGQVFHLVSASLHKADTDFSAVDSYKTMDGHGNLQITFFRSLTMPMRYRADIDIDNSAGLQHSFDVLEHWVTNGRTHPYDIHQILTFHQRLDPGYTLSA